MAIKWRKSVSAKPSEESKKSDEAKKGAKADGKNQDNKDGGNAGGEK